MTFFSACHRWLGAALGTLGLAGCLQPDRVLPPVTSAVDLAFRVPTPDEMYPSRPAADSERLYAEGITGGLHAFRLADGAIAWTFPRPADGFIGPPVVHEGRVLSLGDKARALDARTGALLWEQALAVVYRRDLAAAADGRFFVGLDTVIAALDVQTGALLWQRGTGVPFPNGGRVRALNAVDGTLFACLQEFVEEPGWRSAGHVFAIDPADGRVRWHYRMQFETEFNFCMGEPIPSGDAVLVADAGGNNYVALDRATGAFRWRHRGDAEWVGPWVAPAGPGDTLFAASNDRWVVALDRGTGRVHWRTRTLSSAKMAVPCGRSVLVSDYGLWVLDRASGATLATQAQTQDAIDDLLVSRFIVRGDTAWILGLGHVFRLQCRR